MECYCRLLFREHAGYIDRGFGSTPCLRSYLIYSTKPISFCPKRYQHQPVIHVVFQNQEFLFDNNSGSVHPWMDLLRYSMWSRPHRLSALAYSSTYHFCLAQDWNPLSRWGLTKSDKWPPQKCFQRVEGGWRVHLMSICTKLPIGTNSPRFLTLTTCLDGRWIHAHS